MTNFEPELTPDDTQPRPAVTDHKVDKADKADPTPGDASVAISEPPVVDGDTQPRSAVESGADTEDIADEDAELSEDARGGCGNTILIGAVLAAVACLFVSIVGLAGLAGYRDGTVEQKTRHAVALQGTIGVQATLARQDCDEKRFELCLERCRFIGTAQPFYAGISACIGSAEIALSATPTPGVTPTPTPEPATPTATLQAGQSGFSREELFIRAKDAVRMLDYENAMKWLEAVRGLDADYERQEVEDMLVLTYQALGTRYQNEGRLSEMIIVIKKALDIRPLSGTNWEFTIDAASLYLSAKGYLVAGDYGRAANVFRLFMERAPTYLDGKQLACEAFSKAGDTEAFQKYGC